MLSSTSRRSQTAHRGRFELAVGYGFAVYPDPSTTNPPGHKFGIIAPRSVFSASVNIQEDAAMHPIAPSSEALRLLMAYVKAMEELPLATPGLRELAVKHVQDLLAMVTGGPSEAKVAGDIGGVRAARLAVIKADIAEHLVDRNLSLKALAARQQLTPRYVQKLFEADGITFSGFVLHQRLARAHGMLRDSAYADRTVSSMAFAAGFGDLSYFNRAFRTRYGATPTEVREVTNRSQSG